MQVRSEGIRGSLRIELWRAFAHAHLAAPRQVRSNHFLGYEQIDRRDRESSREIVGIHADERQLQKISPSLIFCNPAFAPRATEELSTVKTRAIFV